MEIKYNPYELTPEILIDDINDFTVLAKWIRSENLPSGTTIAIDSQINDHMYFDIKEVING